MFRIVLTILTAATFVAHGLFGCCWHHGHGHAVSRVGGVKASAHCHEHGHHRHSHHDSVGACAEAGHSSHHDSHSPHDAECDEDQCVFARTQDGPQLSGNLPMACAISFVAVLPVDSLELPPADLSAIAAQNHRPSLAAPLCALSQLWLI